MDDLTDKVNFYMGYGRFSEELTVEQKTERNALAFKVLVALATNLAAESSERDVYAKIDQAVHSIKGIDAKASQ